MSRTDDRMDETGGRGRGLGEAIREFLFGMTGHEFAREALETRAHLESIFLVTVMGDMIGLPVMPPYYSLRLLPYAVPAIASWKRRVLREQDLATSHDYELHGV